MKYLITTEGSKTFQCNTLSANDFCDADDGIVSIINVRNMTEYYAGSWYPMLEWSFR